MTKHNTNNRWVSRRGLLGGLLATGATATALSARRRQAKAAEPNDAAPPKFLIVLGAFGGASIIDSFMAFADRETTNPDTLNAYPDTEVQLVPGTPFRAVNRTSNLFGSDYISDQASFVQAHSAQMLVATQTGTSVNHAVAQKRSLSGNGAWMGRTLQECVAMEYGRDCPLPNVTMGALGFRGQGDDPTLPAEVYAEPVAAPRIWPLSLSGHVGVQGSPDPQVMDLARNLRNGDLDPESEFYKAFRLSDKLDRWKAQREDQQPTIEQADLIGKLNYDLVHPSLPTFPPADLAALQGQFANLAFDPLEAQAATAFLLLKHRVSVAVTMSPTWNLVANEGQGGPTILNPPLSFDYSHGAHRVAQAIMWQRTLDVIDSLITLLRNEPYAENPGDSLWDHTLIYVATDFGRSKVRQAGSSGFGTGHHLNNGNLIVSPLVRGNTLLGGLDTETGLTYGYDPLSGAPLDVTRDEMGERYIFAGVLRALGVDTSGSGLPTVTAFT